ncbi:MAG: transposase [Candidatus Pacebacteria bacterium]|nr:transposase [Candidatus Paceibacterota bacterium]
MTNPRIPLVTGEFYHVFNRGVAFQPIFLSTRDYKRMLKVIDFYRRSDFPLRYSKFLLLPKKERQLLWEKVEEKQNYLVKIIAFCLMPNHFHFLLKQEREDGIKEFISQIANSYTKYFNTKRKRIGPLFQGRFKAVRVETEAQLLHLSRYIHLNPFSAYLLKDRNQLTEYPYSSFPEYLGKKELGLCDQGVILDRSRNRNDYRKFVLDQADYQRRLEEIKHLFMED